MEEYTMKTVTEWDESTTSSGLPAPAGWYIVDHVHNYHNPKERVGSMWARLIGQHITVIEDVNVKADGRRWLHVSVGKPNHKMPTYEDMQTARALFIGERRECYQVFPTAERYVDFAHVLHLWCCLDEPTGVLPHFDEEIMLEGEKVRSI